MESEKRLIDEYLNGEVPKIKTHFAEIIVSGKTEKPYYNIIFIDPQTREYEVCFGSYSLENVRKWLSEEFEIVDAPTVDAQKWIPVTERLPGFDTERVLVMIRGDLILGYPKMDTDRYVNGIWVRYGDHVTNWMPLPEPPEEAE